jgi:hypothetical protein
MWMRRVFIGLSVLLFYGVVASAGVSRPIAILLTAILGWVAFALLDLWKRRNPGEGMFYCAHCQFYFRPSVLEGSPK